MTDQDTQAPEEQDDRNWFQRLMTEMMSPDQRALYGTLVFFATILAVGWVMLNEPTRLNAYTEQYDGREIQRGANIFASNCSTCHGIEGKGAPGVAPALNYEGFFNGDRLAEVGFAGTLRNYISLTVAAGRPVKGVEWANPMPTWGQRFGGPLRDDQIEDVTSFILNWQWQYTDDCPEGFPEAECGVEIELVPAVEVVACEALGPDWAETPLPLGDPARGSVLYGPGGISSVDGAPLGCSGCHTIDGNALVGPSFLGIIDRVNGPGYEAYDSVPDYIHESVMMPGNFLAPGFENGGMPANFSERLCAQDLADLTAFILDLNGAEIPPADEGAEAPAEGEEAPAE